MPLLTLTLAPFCVPRTCTLVSGASEGERIATHSENAKSAILNLDGRDVGHLPKDLWRPKMFVIGCDF